MVIYAVWKESSLKGGYIGQAKSGTSADNDRIKAHILSIADKADSCGQFILKHGIGGCRYGYGDESEGFGVAEQGKQFQQEVGINGSLEDHMHFAEIMHIMGNKLDLSSTNLAIGGGGGTIDLSQTKPIKALLNHKICQDVKDRLDMNQKEGKVSFVDFSDLFTKTSIEQKFYYPQVYLGCRIIARAAPGYVIKHLNYVSMLAQIIKGNLDEQGIEKLIKKDITNAANQLIQEFNTNSSIQITNMMFNELFKQDGYEKLAKELYKRFNWFKGKKKTPISFEELLKGFATKTGGTLIPVVTIVRQNSLNALATMKTTPSGLALPQGIPTKRYDEASGNIDFIKQAARLLFNRAASVVAVSPSRDKDLYAKMLEHYLSIYHFLPESSTISQGQVGYRLLVSVNVGLDHFTESRDETGELISVTSKKTAFEYIKPQARKAGGGWYYDYQTWSSRTVNDLYFWCL